MAKIYITFSVLKEIRHHEGLLDELLREIKKHFKGLKNLISIYSPDNDSQVLKAYLYAGKIRAAILLKVSKKIYIPFLIAKKESVYGWNLSKYSENILYGKILKIERELKLKKYSEFEILEII